MIPEKYKWLLSEGAPKMIVEGLKLVGIKEVVGKQHNPIILGWAKETGLEKVYTADEIPWCGLVHGYLAKLAGKEIVKDPLWALNWGNFGIPAPEPMLGDTLTFKRPGGGHVGLYVSESKNTYHVMGGNQGNAYGFTEIDKFRLQKARRPIYSIAQPPNVRKIFMDSFGKISTDEA
jgi:uncharacterized protein (TIGR02594 family)